jgi:hypothetical protein
LIEPCILLLLSADVLSDHRFVSTYGRNEVPSGPEVLPYKIALPLAVDSGQMDCALALDVPHHLGHCLFGRDRDHHVDVVGHQMPFLDSALLLQRQFAKYFSEMLPQFLVERLSAALGNEHDMIFALHFV